MVNSFEDDEEDFINFDLVLNETQPTIPEHKIVKEHTETNLEHEYAAVEDTLTIDVHRYEEPPGEEKY